MKGLIKYLIGGYILTFAFFVMDSYYVYSDVAAITAFKELLKWSFIFTPIGVLFIILVLHIITPLVYEFITGSIGQKLLSFTILAAIAKIVLVLYEKYM